MWFLCWGGRGWGCICLTPPLLAGARYSNMLWLWVLNILSRLQGIGSVQKKSWFRAESASILLLGSRVRSLSIRSQA